MSRVAPLPRMPESVDMLPDTARRIAAFYRILTEANVPERLAHELTVMAFGEMSKPLYAIPSMEDVRQAFTPRR